ncbi:oxidoreductase [Paramagnetospirillum caucaseum]|uniref:Oxidoreductase n=1 Tax=Paramagnetospirillum caucaseum TaxID=1244869 RepID=M2Z4N7_9PROT|nr:Gfo/Idh/MocA family oxidoreductase [Paramagnetospirillum caucaseum]EME69325.1 oxidoreductase [Paramagnetospirillum caucaseum]
MRALFLGLGGVGQRHLRNLRRLHPEAEIRAVRTKGRAFEINNDLTIDESVDVMDKYRVTALPDLATGLAWAPDLAVVSTPSALHVEHCLALLESGVPVMVEKPAATDSKGYAHLEEAAAKAGLPLMVAYQQRFNPLVARLRTLLAAGRVGRVQSLEVTVHSHMPSWHGYEKPGEFYAGQRALGGGVVMTEIHELDLLGWLFGPASNIHAVGGTTGEWAIDVEDSVAAIMEFQVEGRRVPAAVSLSFVQNPPARRFVVNGSKGRLTMELPKLAITIEEAGRPPLAEQLPDFDRNELFLAELSHFLDCVARRAEPLSSLAACRAGQDLASEMLRQVRKGMEP